MKKNKKPVNKINVPKFIAEQNYADEGLGLEDTKKEVPGYIEEEGITSTEDEENEKVEKKK